MKKVLTGIFCLVVFLTNAQISPLLEYDYWIIEQIVTEDETFHGDENNIGYLNIEQDTNTNDELYVWFFFGGCQYLPIFNNENNSFIINIYEHSCELSADDYPFIELKFTDFFLETYNPDAENCDCPYTYEFREEGNKIYLDITNIEGSVATLSNTTLSNTNFEKVELALYPNPTSNLLHIETNQTDVTAVEIFDVQGKSVKQVSLTNETSIDVSDLANGMYFVKIATANGQVTRKFVKK